MSKAVVRLMFHPTSARLLISPTPSTACACPPRKQVHKSKAVVRFMFHSPDDVRWFRPVDLWTKAGRRGRIREPVSRPASAAATGGGGDGVGQGCAPRRGGAAV